VRSFLKMNSTPFQEKRKSPRYGTDLKIKFYVHYDIHTKIDFLILHRDKKGFFRRKYKALSKNISAEGLAFLSPKQLKAGDRLVLFVRVPASKKPIRMEGEVRWCQPTCQGRDYDTGVQLISVEGQSVEKSLILDPIHKVTWSIVLESVFSSFKHEIFHASTQAHP